ncbi:MAG: tail fiber domain-containing protein, partial [Bacteroidota bacterium]
GYSNDKGVTEEYMRVTGDSVRVYIETDPLAKGVKGGFAVGGISRTTKGEGDDYLTVEPAGTHVFFDEEVAAKGVKGGFAVGGYSNTKSASNQLMSLTPKNYFIGHEAGLNIGLDGLYNQFIGYQAGRLTSSADYNVFLGYQAGMNNTTGGSNILLGYRAGLNFNGTDNVVIGTSALQNGQMYNSVVIGKEAALNAQGDGWGNVMVGYRSGYNNKVSGGSGIYGARNVFLGRQAGEANDQGGNNVYVGAFAGNDNVNGLRNVCVGDDAGGVGNAGSNNVYTGERAGYTNRGNGNIVIGREAGSAETNYTLDSNYDNNVMIGYRSGFVNKTGDGNVFIGGYSGYNETGANKLYIANTTSKTLIWGDFTNDYVRINDHVGIGTSPHSNYGLLVDGPDAYYSLVVYKGAYAYGTGFVDGSDRNLKKNILTLENTLDKVMNLRGVTYRWDTDNPDAGTSDESTQIGVIAQEVEAVFPELVTENPDGYKGVSYGKLSAVLIEAIKEQQSMIDQQQKVIEELQTRLDILEKK